MSLMPYLPHLGYETTLWIAMIFTDTKELLLELLKYANEFIALSPSSRI